MNRDHPLLAGIRTGVATSGSHSQHWGELRRSVFPGEESWAGLKAWCAENELECELAFGQSSRKTEVQFRTRRKATVKAQLADPVTVLAAVAPEAAATEAVTAA